MKIPKKRTLILAGIPVILVLLFWIVLISKSVDGPVYTVRDMPELEIPEDLLQLDQYVKNTEAGYSIKPDNQARIIWANEQNKTKTDYALVYLHGFSSTWKDGYPVNERFAQTFGINMYISRLFDHGLTSSIPLDKFKAQEYWDSAVRALNIGKRLGDSVIIMGTSAGGALALALAAQDPQDVTALLLMSPLIRISDPASFILDGPLGPALLRLANNGEVIPPDTEDPDILRYWHKPYSIYALPQLERFVEDMMTRKTFKAITLPVWTGVYYKDKENQDDVISVRAAQRMFKQLSTPNDKKKYVEFPETGNHVIGSDIRSQDYDTVWLSVKEFAEDVLNLQPG